MPDEQESQGWEREPVDAGGSAMSIERKVALGVLTFWPPVYFVLFIVFIVASIALQSSGASAGPDGLIGVILPLHLFTILDILGLTIYYAVHVYREPALRDDRKLLWMVIVLLGGFIGQAAYFVLWIVKRSPIVSGGEAVPASSPGSGGAAA